MPKRVSDPYLSGPSIIVWVPLRLSASMKSNIHKEIKEYFLAKTQITGDKCSRCNRKIDKETFSDIIAQSLRDEIGIITLDALRTISPFNKLFNKWTKEFWENFPFKDRTYIVTRARFIRESWENFKKKDKYKRIMGIESEKEKS